jgi:hypothetical protein
VRGALALVGVPSAADGSLLYVGEGPGSIALYISWNCVGWQTLLFLAVSFTYNALLQRTDEPNA